jgi:RNA-binding protein YhbY
MNLSILVIIVIVIVIFCNKIRIEKYSNNLPQIDNIFKKYITKSKDIVQIGKGTNSKVVYDVNYPLYAFKIIKNKDLIKKNNDEIKAYQQINQHLKFNKILSLPNAKLLKFYGYKIYLHKNEKLLIIMLERVVFGNQKLTNIVNLSNLSVPFLNDGKKVDINYLKNVLGKNLNNYMKQLGKLFATIHYICHHNINDCEIYLGYKNNKYIFYIGDLDDSKYIKNYKNRNSILSMVKSIDTALFFRKKSKSCFKSFSKGYLEISKIVEADQYAQKVLKILNELIERNMKSHFEHNLLDT